MSRLFSSFFFFFNDTATTEIYTLSLYDALPISDFLGTTNNSVEIAQVSARIWGRAFNLAKRSEEHTSELQSPCNLVCRLLLEKKKTRRGFYSSSMTHPCTSIYLSSVSYV